MKDSKSGLEASTRVLALIIGSFALAYLIQVFSPLRVFGDPYRLLSMAVSAYEGNGYIVDGQLERYPIGYPLVVKTLMELGLASSMTLILLNISCLFFALYLFYALGRRYGHPSVVVLALAFVLSSWVTIKHVTMPMTEFLYLAVSFSAVFCICRFWQDHGSRKWWYFAFSVLLVYAAIQCRSVGLTLVPVLVLVFLMQPEITRIRARFAWNPPLVTVAVLGGLLVVYVSYVFFLESEWFQLQFAERQSYGHSFFTELESSGFLALLAKSITIRTFEFGEVLVNVPYSKAPWLAAYFYGVGIIAWLAVARGLWLIGQQRGLLPIALYFLSYTSLMMLWPWGDSRFWLPVLPIMVFMVLIAVQDLGERRPRLIPLSRAYATYFMGLGVVAIVYSSYVSLSGKDFGDYYGDGSGKMTYRYAFQSGRPIDIDQVSAKHLRLLGIFEPLAVRAELTE